MQHRQKGPLRDEENLSSINMWHVRLTVALRLLSREMKTRQLDRAAPKLDSIFACLTSCFSSGAGLQEIAELVGPLRHLASRWNSQVGPRSRLPSGTCTLSLGGMAILINFEVEPH